MPGFRRSALAVALVLSVVPGLARAVILGEFDAPGTRIATIAVKGGVGWSRVTGDAHGAEARPGVVAGLHADVPVSPVFAVRGEVLYREMGARRVDVGTAFYQGQPPPVPVFQDARRTYLELSFLAKVRPAGGRAYWLVGPTLDAQLAESVEYSQDYNQRDYWDPDWPSDWYRSNGILEKPATTIGTLLVGMGADFRVGRTALFAEARYQWGLQDLNRTAQLVLHDRSLTVVTGVQF